MKVLIISHAYVASENRKKLEELSKFCGLEVGVVMPREWRTWHGKNIKYQISNTKNSCTVFTLPVVLAGDGGRFFYQPLSLWRAIKRFNPDVIHIEEEPWMPVMFEIVLFNNLFFRKKLIFFSWENLDLGLGWWRTIFERFTLNRAVLAIAGNSGAKERLRKRGFARKIEVLPQFGVDYNKFKMQSAKIKIELKRKLGLSRFVVGFVGRLVPEKGVATLFKAVAKLSNRPGLLLVSTAPELPDEFQKLADELGITKRLRVIGGVPHEELPSYLNLMDVLVLPSLTALTWKEQFGRVLIEAMACNVPVIGSSSGAIPETVGDAGLVFREGDADDLGSKIEILMEDETLRSESAEKGYRRVQKNFTFAKIAKETYRIYQSL